MYQCPNCGGNLKFDIASQQLACEFCQTKMDPYSFQKEKDAEESSYYEATIFTCPQCGGELLSTDTDATAFCSFCGASTILDSRISKERRPGYIIPFTKTKEDCKKAYTAMTKRAIFAPKELKDEKYIDSFRGIYMPYWTYYFAQQKSISLPGEKQHRRGDFIVTEHYSLRADLNAYYKGLSYDASSSFDDSISEKLAPYDVKNMKPFTPSFLSGFYADTADVDKNLYEPQAAATASMQTIDHICNAPEFAAYGPDRLQLSPESLGTECKAVDGAMFPVWFLSYRNGDRVAYATVNGQTGKVVADLPVDRKKYLIGSLLLAIPIFILLNLFLVLTPGKLAVVTAALAAIAAIIYGMELSQIRRKDFGLDDRGLQAKRYADAAQSSPQQPAGATQVSDNTYNLTNKPGFWCAIAALVLSAAIVMVNPASDLIFYGVSALSMVAVLISLLDIIKYYNILATRRLPQFNKQGGDDRA